jgi:DNA-binding response OmpR family regulator
MIKRALVVSTKVPLRASIARVLQSLGYLVEFADSWKRALELAEQGPLEAAIIVSGSQSANLAQKLRGRVPRTIEIDERTHDLEARILEQLPHALTPRHGPGDKTTLAIRRIEQCTLDPNDRIFRDDHGRQVRLTRAEVALLATLMDNSSHVWSRAELRHAAFGRGT